MYFKDYLKPLNTTSCHHILLCDFQCSLQKRKRKQQKYTMPLCSVVLLKVIPKAWYTDLSLTLSSACTPTCMA